MIKSSEVGERMVRDANLGLTKIRERERDHLQLDGDRDGSRQSGRTKSEAARGGDRDGAKQRRRGLGFGIWLNRFRKKY